MYFPTCGSTSLVVVLHSFGNIIISIPLNWTGACTYRGHYFPLYVHATFNKNVFSFAFSFLISRFYHGQNPCGKQ